MKKAVERLQRVLHIGENTAENLVEEKGVEGIEELLKLGKDGLKEVHGVGNYKAEKILMGAKELKNKLIKCDFCGYYFDAEKCPYCEEDKKANKNRKDDSIIYTFIEKKSKRDQVPAKKIIFYRKMIESIKKKSEELNVKGNLVKEFVNKKKNKKNLEIKINKISEELKTLRREQHIYEFHIDSFKLILDKVGELQDRGRYIACLEVLKQVEKKVQEMKITRNYMESLEDLIEEDIEGIELDLNTRLASIRKGYRDGDFKAVRKRIDNLVSLISVDIEIEGHLKDVTTEVDNEFRDIDEKEHRLEDRFEGPDKEKTSTNGFVNGLENESLRTDYEGNNDGFINGFQKEKKDVRKKINWDKVKVLGLIFILIAGIFVTSYYFYLPGQETHEIIIDGKFDDWDGIENYKMEMQGISPSSLITESAIMESEKSYNIYIKTKEEALTGGENNKTDSLYCFIKAVSIKKSSTYNTGMIYSHQMVEIHGWKDEIYGELYLYENKSCNNNWNDWKQVSSLKIEKRDTEIEFTIPKSYFKGEEIISHIYAKDHMGKESENEYLISSKKPSLCVHQIDLEKNVLTDETMVLKLKLKSYGGPVTVDEISFNGENNFKYLNFEPKQNFPIKIKKNEEKVLEVMGSPDVEPGEKIGLKINTIKTNGISTIIGTGKYYYYQNIPEEKEIDNCFGDWDNHKNDPEDEIPSNIDINEYQSFYEGDEIYFYLKTRGDILSGTPVPEKVKKFRIKKIDTDRDSIPDKVDPYPNDFNNDGISDVNSMIGNFPDVDKDGKADAPTGNDFILNTTIPNSTDYPVSYRGKNIEIWIGEKGKKPKITGEDTLEIYVDRDGLPSTGASFKEIGADYKIILTGQYGSVKEWNIMEWNESTKIWGLTPGNFNHELNGDSIELSCSNLARVIQNYDVVFITKNWYDQYDSSVIKSVVRTKSFSDDVNQIFYLRDSDRLSTKKGANQSSVSLINKEGDKYHKWKTNNLAGNFNVTKAITVPIYLNPFPRGNNKPNLNVTVSTSSSIIGYGEINGLTSEGWYTVPVEPLTKKINSGESITLNTTISGDSNTESLQIDIYYNSYENASRIKIPTNTTVKVEGVTSYNETGSEEETFQGGDIVKIRSNCTHPISADLIEHTNISIYYPNGSYFIKNKPMDIFQKDSMTPPYFTIFNKSFVLKNNTPGGKYQVVINSLDDQSHKSTGDTYFTVPKYPGVSVFPDREKLGEPGSKINFTITVENIGNLEDLYDLNPSESTRRWQTNLYKNSTEIAKDSNGDGVWDWINSSWDNNGDGNPDVVLKPQEELVLNVQKLIPNEVDGQSDTTYFYAISSNFTDISDNSELVVNTPSPSKIKTLYLHENNTMNTSMGNDTIIYDISPGSSNTWSQIPEMAEDFNLLNKAQVQLYLEPTISGHKVPDVTVSLLDDGDIINSDTIYDISSSGWYTFNITTEATISKSDPFELRISSGDEKISIYHNSALYNSRIDLQTDTYIDVLNITTFNKTSQSQKFNVGDKVEVTAEIGDPLGSYDITGANISVLNPNGTFILRNKSMYLYELDPNTPSYWAKYNSSFIIKENGSVGRYEIQVEAIESNGVMSKGYDNIEVISSLEIYPDRNKTVYFGKTVSYNHTIINNGGGGDIIEIKTESSTGFNISIYSENGILISRDLRGDGEWDYINSAWDSNSNNNPDTGWMLRNESLNITIEIEIPDNASNLTDHTEVKAASYYTSEFDTAIDITYVPEFGRRTLMVTVFSIMLLNIFWTYKIKKSFREY